MKDLIVNEDLPQILKIVPVSEKPLFPGIIAPLFIKNEKSISIIEESIKQDFLIGVILKQDEDHEEENTKDSLYKVGSCCRILKVINNPEGGISIFVSVLKRFKIQKFLSDENQKIIAAVTYPDSGIEKYKDDITVMALVKSIVEKMKKLTEDNPLFSEEIKINMLNITEPNKISDFIASLLNIDGKIQQEILECFDLKDRLNKVFILISKEVEIYNIQKKVQREIDNKIKKTQKEYFLKEQLKAIKQELGIPKDGQSSDYLNFKKKIDKIKFENNETREQIYNELEKFSLIEKASSEYNILRTYLDIITSLPWENNKAKNIDIKRSQKILNEDHYGLEDVKERILEFISVFFKKKSNQGAIICLVGPPGVGKTSVGKSIARALNRKFFRFSVGGMRDEAEIKGHRRTYVGAMPGKIIQGLKIEKTKNIVFMIDEIDKMGNSYQGDPSSALLEVLDPEQNKNFRDNYLDLPFDISNIIFIATANTLDNIPSPLLDRMEIIRLSGYILDEKIEIGKKYIIPKSLIKNGLEKNEIKYNKNALMNIIEGYAREAGLRHFEQVIDKINRKVVKSLVLNEDIKLPVEITEKNLFDYLGQKIFNNEGIEINKPGMVTGLAWTSMGGDTLTIESLSVPDKEGFKLTGKLGEVMQESANIAYTYVKKITIEKLIKYDYKYDAEFFKKYAIHLHVPQGATPKDGPSAGITMASALLSLVLNKKISNDLAMTGELSLTGKVLPIGGLKEKVIAAKRSNIKRIIIPFENEKDLEKIPEKVKKEIEFFPVKRINEVFDILFKK